MKIKFLQAKNGDSILMNFFDPEGEERFVLIDGGTSATYHSKRNKKIIDGALKTELNKLDKIDLLILTHIDNDHIGGVLKLFEDDKQASKIKKFGLMVVPKYQIILMRKI